MRYGCTLCIQHKWTGSRSHWTTKAILEETRDRMTLNQGKRSLGCLLIIATVDVVSSRGVQYGGRVNQEIRKELSNHTAHFDTDRQYTNLSFGHTAKNNERKVSYSQSGAEREIAQHPSQNEIKHRKREMHRSFPGRAADGRKVVNDEVRNATSYKTIQSEVETLTTKTSANTTARGTAKGQGVDIVVFIVVFLVLYTSSVGMLILYNVNHHKKYHEEEQLKASEETYHRNKEITDLQQRVDLYMRYKALYGNEAEVPTTPPPASPRQWKFKSFKRRFSGKDFSVPSKLRKGSSAPDLDQIHQSIRRNKRDLPRLPVVPEHRPLMGTSTDEADEDEPNPREEELPTDDRQTQTWHPSSMSKKDQAMLWEIRRPALEKKRVSEPEISAVFVLKKNHEKKKSNFLTPDEIESAL